MRRLARAHPLLFLLALLLATAACIKPHEGTRKLGAVELETSCGPQAETRIRDGLALFYHMLHEQASRSFLAATALEPECAMGHWGLAISRVRPLYAGTPGPEALAEGAKELERARTVAGDDEQALAYIAAAESYFRDGPEAWERAQGELRASRPGDPDAAALHALALLESAPIDDGAHRSEKRVLEILEPLRAEHATHPGVAHYLVQACDNAEMAERGLEFARAYQTLAPDLPLTAHSASHIFIRLGRWDDAIGLNVAATGSAQRFVSVGGTPALFAHASDYLIYAYLQSGWDRRAAGYITRLGKVRRWEDDFATAHALAAAPARFHLERRDWNGAAKVGTAGGEDFPWEKYPAARAVTQFARGIGAARSDDLPAARKALAELERLRDAVEPPGSYWAGVVDAHRRALSAWIDLGDEGRTDQALREMRTAADAEDAVERHRVSPGPVISLRDLFGDMLLEADRPEEALAEFETSLAAAPGRFYSLFKAGRTAASIDANEKARKYFGQLLRLVEASRSDRPEVEKAKYYLRILPKPSA